MGPATPRRKYSISRAQRRGYRPRSLGDPLLIAQLNTGRGAALGSLGRDARHPLEEALDLSRQIGNRSRIATALDNIGILELAAGNLKAARSRIAEALEIFRELGDLHETIAVSVNLGLVCYLEQDRENAARLFTDAVRAVGRGGDAEILALALLGLALTRIETETAARLHGAADVVLEQLGFSLEPLESRLRERDHARLRKALGDDSFQSAYTTGHALSRTGRSLLRSAPSRIALRGHRYALTLPRGHTSRQLVSNRRAALARPPRHVCFRIAIKDRQLWKHQARLPEWTRRTALHVVAASA